MRSICAIAAAALLLIPVAPPAARPPDGGTDTDTTSRGRTYEGSRIVLLGTGTPNADPERSGPAVAIVVEDISYIVDCGPGVVRRASAARREHGIEALRARNLERLFITHLHSDHTAGYPDFIFTPWVLERDEPLLVYGPPGTRKMTGHILKAYEEDIRIRLDGLEPANDRGHRVIVREIEPGIFYRDDRVTVEAFPVRHGSFEHAFGFRFVCPDRTIVVSGDTGPCDSLVAAAAHCDVLIHEVYALKPFGGRTPEWQRYHRSFHTSSRELADIARRVEPGLLILYHQLFWGATGDELVAEIAEIYTGRIVSGRDLDLY